MSSTVIDNKVVEMHFDNKDFEKNIQQSMTSLDRLKTALNIDSVKSLDQLSKSASNFNMDGVGSAIETCKIKFSALQIAGVTALAKITSQAMDMGTKLIKSLSIDQVTAGFDKYAMKTQSVQTIIAATGESMAKVTEQLDKLNWFTDETSYNLVDMTNNIAKFTSNGIKLEDATRQMQGIATAAALAGTNSEGASHAMEGFSKAIAKGYMDRRNWTWIQTARMDTMQFKQALIEAAVEAGTLSKVADGVYKTMAGHEVTVTNFEEAMKDGWINTKAMTLALEEYGNFSEVLYDSLQKLDNKLTTSELLDYLDEYKKGTLDINEAAKDLNVSTEEFTSIMDTLNDSSLDLGNKAFRAAQEAKTFREAIDAVKDAVSTGWMTTFEQIFGDYKEAKKLWTGVANAMWDAFAAGGEERNAILKEWKALGGRDSLIIGAVEAVNLLIGPLSAVKAAFKSMFPDIHGMATILKDLTDRFKDFTTKLRGSDSFLQATKDIYLAFKGIFSIGKLVLDVLGAIIKGIFPALSPVGSLAGGILHVLGLMGAYTTAIVRFIESTKTFKSITEGLADAVAKVKDIFVFLAKIAGGAVLVGLTLLIKTISKVVTSIKSIATSTNFVTKAIDAVRTALGKVGEIFSSIFSTQEKVTAGVKKMTKYFGGANEAIAQTGTVTNTVNNTLTKHQSILQKVASVVKTVVTVIGGAIILIIKGYGTLITYIGEFFTRVYKYLSTAEQSSNSFSEFLKKIFDKIKEHLGAIGDVLGEINGERIKKAFASISEGIGKFSEKITPGKIAAIGFSAALLILIASIIKVTKQITKSVTAVSSAVTSVSSTIKSFSDTIRGRFEKKKTNPLLEMAYAFGIVATSLALLTQVPQDKLKNVAILMGAMMVGIAALALVMAKLSKVLEGKGMKNGLAQGSKALLAIAGATGILALSLAALAQIDLEAAGGLEGMLTKVGLLSLLLVALGGVAIIISNYTKEGQLIKGSLFILSLAGATRMITDSLIKIGSSDLSQANDNIPAILAMFSGLALMAFAAGKVKLTSALAIGVLAVALKMAFPMLLEMAKELARADYEKFFAAAKKNIGMIVLFIGAAVAVGYLFQQFSKIGQVLLGLGVAAAGLAVGVKILASVVKDLTEFIKTADSEALDQALGVIYMTMAVMAAVISLCMIASAVAAAIAKIAGVDDFKAGFVSMGIAFVAMAGAIFIISKAMDTMVNAAIRGPEQFATVQEFVSGLIILLGVVTVLAGIATKDSKAIPTLIALVVTISILFAELAIFTFFTPQELVPGIMAMVVVMGLLAVVLSQLAKLGDKKVNTSMIITVLGALIALSGTLIVLAQYPWQNVLTAGASLTAVMFMLDKLLQTISSSSGLGNAATSGNKLKMLLAVTLMLGAVGASLAIVAMHPWEQVLGAALGISGVMLMLAGMLKLISSMKLAKDITSKLTSMLAVTLMMGAVGVALAVLANIPWQQLLSAAAAISLTMLALAGVMMIMSKMGKGSVGMLAAGASMIMVAGAMVIIAEAVKQFEGISWESLGKAGATLGALTVAMAAIGAIAGALPMASVGMLAFSVAAAGLAITFMLLAPALKQFETIDWESIGKAGAVLGGLFVALALAGVIVNFLPLAAVGMAAFAISAIGLAVAFTVITSALQQFSSISWDDLAKAGVVLGALVAAFLLIGVVVNFLPLVAVGMLAFTASMLGTAVAFTIIAVAINILSVGIAALIPSLEALTSINLLQIAAGLALFAGSVMLLGVAGVLSLTASVGVGVLAVALLALSVSLMLLNPSLQLLQSVDLISIALGLGAIGAVGAVLGLLFPVVAAGAASLMLLAAALAVLTPTLTAAAIALQIFSTVAVVAFTTVGTAAVGMITKIVQIPAKLAAFWRDLGQSFVSNVPNVVNIAKQAGELIGGKKGGGGLLGGLSAALGWNSPPRAVNELMADTGSAFQNGATTVAPVAESSGSTIGTSFGEGLLSKIQSALSTAWDGVKSFFTNLAGIDGVDISLDSIADSFGDIGDAAGEAMEAMGFEQATLDAEDFLGVTDDATESVDGLTESMGGLGDEMEKTGKSAKSTKDFIKDLASTIEGQLNIFNKFETKQEITAQQMLDNMKSNIDGFASWSHRLAVLAERGIDQALYQKLAEMGPQGYETVAAFVQMTDEQLQEANQLFATSLTLPQSQADIVGAGFQYAGEMAVQGFSNALDDHMAAHNAAYGLGQAALDGINEVLEVHSPSEATRQTGMYTIDGLVQGLQNFQKMTVLRLAVFSVCNIVLSKFRQELSTDKTYEIGKNAVMGLANGLGDSEAASKVRSNAESIAKEAYETMQSALKERSPSKITTQIGKYASLGLANGITDGSRDVAKASTNVADMAVAGLQNAVDKINDFISLNINPIITPILDLSYMQEQMSAINSSFGTREVGAGQIQNGDGSTATTSTGVTYVQNNYSPKELSRIDIYRNTRNQLSMIGKVVRANA